MPPDQREEEPGWDLTLSPLERDPRREPQTYQELSPQLDFLYRCESEFAQWVQFADAKSGGVILVLGSEGRGLRPRVAGACDELIALPMRGRIGSLNVAAAASAILYEILQAKLDSSS